MSRAFASSGGAWRRREQIVEEGSAIIRFFASKTLSFMRLESQVLKRTPIAIAVLVAASLVMVSCGTSVPNPNATQSLTSGLTFRVFVSNPLQPAPAGGGTAVLNVVNATTDQLTRFAIGVSSQIALPGLMALSPDKKFTIVFSSANNAVSTVDNTNERLAVSGTSSLPAINLPGFTQSMFVGPDNATAYAAVPIATVLGQVPGAVIRMNLGVGTVSATVAVPGVRYIVQSHTGSRILALDGSSNTLTLIAPTLIATNAEARTLICADGTPAAQYNPTLCAANPPTPRFDHPSWAVFSADDTTAYIFNCGPECGGAAASVTILDLNSNTATVTIPVEGATFGLLSGNTLYVAGTPPTTVGINSCAGSTTLATTCGRLDTVDLGTMTVTGSAIISDGSHSRMEIASGQLFVGATGCTNVNVAPSGGNPGEVRGCLSIFDTSRSKVVVAPFNGDVTGMTPITNRNVVYVVEAGELQIYDTTTDALQSTQIDIIGQAIDVKLVDK
jgi:hypothetical protein